MLCPNLCFNTPDKSFQYADPTYLWSHCGCLPILIIGGSTKTYKLNENQISIDELARKPISSKLYRAIDNILPIVIKHKDEHVALKADNQGIQMNSKVRFKKLGIILLGIFEDTMSDLVFIWQEKWP